MKRSHVRFLTAFAVIAATIIFAALSWAQLPTGSVQGTITDPSGAVVSGAKVTN